jgi:hypothetical protein
MGMQNNERNPNVDIIPIGTTVTSTTVVYPGLFLRKRSSIKNVWLVNTAAISKDNTNHVTVQLQDNAGSPVAYASADTSDNAVVAVTQYALALQAGGGTGINSDSATQHELDVPASTQLNVSVISAGSAKLTNGVLVVEWYPL